MSSSSDVTEITPLIGRRNLQNDEEDRPRIVCNPSLWIILIVFLFGASIGGYLLIVQGKKNCFHFPPLFRNKLIIPLIISRSSISRFETLLSGATIPMGELLHNESDRSAVSQHDCSRFLCLCDTGPKFVLLDSARLLPRYT